MIKPFVNYAVVFRFHSITNKNPTGRLPGIIMRKQYINKWYTFKVCGLKVIIYITGFEKAGEKYQSDSYVGNKTVILQNGLSYSEPYACCKKSFHYYIKSKEIKPFKY